MSGTADRDDEAPVLVVVADLMLRQRVVEGLRGAGRPVAVASGPARMRERVEDRRPACVVVDLEIAGMDPVEEVLALRRGPAAGVPVLAFGSHVRADMIKRARDAGFERVVARSQIASDLGRLVEEVVGPSG